MFCLYDELTVLGTPAAPQHGKWESDFLGLVHDSGIVTNEGAYFRDSERLRKIIAAAQRRFAAFVNTGEREVPEEVVERLLGAEAITRCWDARDRFLHVAESSHDVDLGLQQLRSALAQAGRPDRVPASAGFDSYALTFVMRTFLYLAYADAERLNLTLDSNRQPISSRLLEGEAEFRSRVLARLGKAYRSTPGAADLKSRRRLSPFAAIVFQRARPHKRRTHFRDGAPARGTRGRTNRTAEHGGNAVRD